MIFHLKWVGEGGGEPIYAVEVLLNDNLSKCKASHKVYSATTTSDIVGPY